MDEVVGRVVRSTDIQIVYAGKQRDLVCPNCGDYLTIMLAAYGWYATCRRDRARWTHIEGIDGVAAERWTPMNERDRLTGLPIRLGGE